MSPGCDVGLRICIDLAANLYRKKILNEVYNSISILTLMFTIFRNSSSDMDSCFFGSYTLSGIQDLNTFDFRMNTQAILPFIFTISWSFTTVVYIGILSNNPIRFIYLLYYFKPRFLLKFFALDDSSDKKMISRNARSKLIDYYFVDFNANQNLVPTTGLSNDLNWVTYNSLVGQYSSSKFQTL